MASAGKELLDEEACGRIEAVAIGPLGDGQYLRGSTQAEMRGQEADVLVVLARTVCQHLRAGDVLSPAEKPEVFLFVLTGLAGERVGSFALEVGAFKGGGRLDQVEEVLEVESGAMRLLITTAPEDEPQ